uniref:hypothetical protein n=1 Tax=Streptomyces sp. F12 TaxID=1436084 RepID=UPI0015E8580A|nr:hypothetical protein [Streptomyces sp. F12]
MMPNSAQTYEIAVPVDPRDFHVCDRLRLVTRDTGFGGRGVHRRTGTVTSVTTRTVTVDCGPDGKARLRSADWRGREPLRVLVPDEPVAIRKEAPDGRILQEYPARVVRAARNGHVHCRETEHGSSCNYPPREVVHDHHAIASETGTRLP